MGIGSRAVLADISSDLHVARSRLSSLLDAGTSESLELEAIYMVLSNAAEMVDDIISSGRRKE